MNKEVAGVFIYNGQPQNGATAKLFNITAFASYADSTATVQDNPLTATAVEVNTSNGAVFAAGDVVRAEIECMLVMAVSVNKLYVIRGYHGTVPAAHVQNTIIYDETVTEPQQDTSEPGAGQQGATITTAVTYGGDGAYRWTAVPEGEYYCMIYYDNHRSYIYHNVERDDPSPEQLLTVRGDILIRDANRVTRLAVGGAGTFLKSDGTDTTWQVGSDSYPMKQKPNLTRWTQPGWIASNFQNQAVTAGRIYYMPIFVEETTTYIRIGIYVSIGDGAGGLADLRIFTWNAGLPDALVLSCGTVSTNALGAQEIIIAQQLTRSYYYLACRCDNTPTLAGISTFELAPVAGIVLTNSQAFVGLTIPYVDAAYADPAPAPTGIENTFYAFVRLREN